MGAGRRAVAVSCGLVAVAALSAAMLGCSDDGSEPAADPTTARVPTGVTATSAFVPDSPFCDTMLDLDARALTDDPPSRVDVIDEYQAIRADVPDEIRDEFEIVLERLRRDEAGAEIADPALADAAAERVAEHVDVHCRGTADNPGPQPTQPP